MNATERFIGWRYLVSRRSIRFINVIGIVSVTGITVGVAALLVALSVFNGFNAVVTSVLVTFDPHIRVEKRGFMDSTEYSSAAAAVGSDARVAAFAPFVSGKALLTAGYHQRAVTVRGIDEKEIGSVTGIGAKMVLGGTSLGETDGLPGIIVGITLADRLSSVVGAEISVVSPAGLQGAISGATAPRQARYRIVGIFESQNKEYDALYKQSEQELDPVKRAAMYVKLNDMVVGDNYVQPIAARARTTALKAGLAAHLSGWDNDLWQLASWYREA